MFPREWTPTGSQRRTSVWGKVDLFLAAEATVPLPTHWNLLEGCVTQGYHHLSFISAVLRLCGQSWNPRLGIHLLGSRLWLSGKGAILKYIHLFKTSEPTHGQLLTLLHPTNNSSGQSN